MFTKKQYLAGECTEHEYYVQFVSDKMIETITRSTTFSKILIAKDKQDFSDIHLKQWDFCTGAVLCILGRTPFREKGDVATHSVLIAICKACAREIIAKRQAVKSLTDSV